MRITDINSQIFDQWIKDHGCIGRVTRKWAWWLNDDASRGLSPCHGTRYLYRGQNRRYWSLAPSISRGIHTRTLALRDLRLDEQSRVLVALIRADWYCRLLKTHPVLMWAKEERFEIDRMALAQHYELPTGYIDLSESLEVALFFACCEFQNGRWQPLSKGRGILYRIDWIAANQ
jgi:FRG domain